MQHKLYWCWGRGGWGECCHECFALGNPGICFVETISRGCVIFSCNLEVALVAEGNDADA
jgi:hypothetical protein